MINHTVTYNFIVQDAYVNQSCYDLQTIHQDSRHDSSGYI